MKIEAAVSSEVFVPIYIITLRHNLINRNRIKLLDN
jgi:hypothetical protein